MRGETSTIRFAEAKKLLDYGFSNFEYLQYGHKGDTAKNILVNKGTLKNVEVTFESDCRKPYSKRSICKHCNYYIITRNSECTYK